MTGSDILSYVEMRMGVTVDSDKLLVAINEALDRLNDHGLLYGTITVDVTDEDEEYSLPNDFTFVEKVFVLDGGDVYLYEGFHYRNGIIYFNDEEKFEIIARKMPKHLTAIGDSFTDLHKMYHQGVKFYVLGWFKENDDDQDPASKKYYKRAFDTWKNAKTQLHRSKEKGKVLVKRRA